MANTLHRRRAKSKNPSPPNPNKMMLDAFRVAARRHG